MFYRFELHTGDDNMNDISEVIVDAPSLEIAWRTLEEQAIPEGYEIEGGDEDRLYTIAWEETGDPEYPIPLHHDYYYAEDHDTFQHALDAIPYYHGMAGHFTSRESAFLIAHGGMYEVTPSGHIHTTYSRFIPRARYYVCATDTFMSGWGKSEGMTNRVVVPCETFHDAEIVADYLQIRGDMTRVTINTTKPRTRHGVLYSVLPEMLESAKEVASV